MALRLPLVQVLGQIQQLQSGDTLDAVTSGGTSIVLTNDEAGSIVIGMPVYADANDGVKKARANASGTTKIIGLVRDATIGTGATGAIQTDGVLAATTTQWDAVAGTTGGLTFNTDYWLSAATAGNLTATAPSTAGQYVAPVGRALSTTELRISVEMTILL